MLSRLVSLAFALGVVAQDSVVVGVSSEATTSTSFFHPPSPTTTAPPSSSGLNTETATLWVGTGIYEDFSVSIVCADTDATTYAIATANADTTLTVTQGPSLYNAQVEANTQGISLSLSETCTLRGTTSASCDITGTEKGHGHHTNIKTSNVVTGDEIATHFVEVSITAGGSKLANPTGKCSTDNAAVPTGFAARDVYKVVIVPVAVIAGGALL